ncbi:MAG: ATP-dependent helicase, partial [Desulfobacterium sp.]|nr:ATP-dependent helicase [Desulfobacterium sp.]
QLDLVITSYSIAQRYEWLGDYCWNYLILDEAQAIKNPGTKQTRAVKKLKSLNRIIMTGTPVENRISDLWSLFDFLNPGLLGNQKEFGAFSKKLKNHPKGYSRLRKIVSPYILRRLKTDKSVISDLPDKVEMKSFADLSKKQIVLYQGFVSDLEKQIEESDGIQRKGLVLSSLMKLKQLCNHPDHLTGTGEYKESDSGKFQRLREICETIYEKRERVLVFTQFREITEPIRFFLETIFNHRGLVIHGSVAAGNRKKIIDIFQAETYCPFMVLTLKAGGVGLNLTKANHVIHFDRWWNPAVENQATDRAFRIGQDKKVIVHKFITRGTIEEKIDKMLDDKKELADQVVSQSGETLITEMDNKQLMNLFRLSL